MKIIPDLFVGLKIITIFAACSNENVRPKIRKRAENNEYLQLKNMNGKGSGGKQEAIMRQSKGKQKSVNNEVKKIAG